MLIRIGDHIRLYLQQLVHKTSVFNGLRLCSLVMRRVLLLGVSNGSALRLVAGLRSNIWDGVVVSVVLSSKIRVSGAG